MLHYQTVEHNTLGLLKSLSLKDYLNNFVLVGGTSLALQIGHRTSIDLDFFTPEIFEAAKIFEKLEQDYVIHETKVKDKSTLIVDVEGVKVDFIRFRYPWQKPFIQIDGLRLLDKEDIAPMKLDAIAGRGRKKDFFDLYFLLDYYSLKEMFIWYGKMFPHQTHFHIWKSLVYFEDAEIDGDPFLLDTNTTWDQVKQKITAEVKKLR